MPPVPYVGGGPCDGQAFCGEHPPVYQYGPERVGSQYRAVYRLTRSDRWKYVLLGWCLDPAITGRGAA